MLPEESLFVVADGMGGHACGEVASSMAVEVLGGFYEETAADLDKTWIFKPKSDGSYESNRLMSGMKLANFRIYEKGQNEPSKKDMGTTVVGMHFTQDSAVVGHVGDSRAYRFRGGALELLTEDHSLVNHYKREKQLSDEELENFPMKNIILRALGMSASVEVELSPVQLEEGDIYIICSDGLCGMISDKAIEAIVRDIQVSSEGSSESDLKAMCRHLVQAANDNGGKDNVTVVCVRVESS